MAAALHITLEQWLTLMAVVNTGGYAQAAEALHKSQSSVTYAVQKLESVLGVKAFEIQGRKAILTPTGQLLYRRARSAGGNARAMQRRPKPHLERLRCCFFHLLVETPDRHCCSRPNAPNSDPWIAPWHQKLTGATTHEAFPACRRSPNRTQSLPSRSDQSITRCEIALNFLSFGSRRGYPQSERAY
jgi:hypothetical protein